MPLAQATFLPSTAVALPAWVGLGFGFGLGFGLGLGYISPTSPVYLRCISGISADHLGGEHWCEAAVVEHGHVRRALQQRRHRRAWCGVAARGLGVW